MRSGLQLNDLSSAARNVRATFDPLSLLIRLPRPENPVALNSDNFWQVVTQYPVSVLAHELAHYFQMTSTAYGLKRMLFYVEGLSAKIQLVQRVSELSGKRLRAPIMEQVQRSAANDSELAKRSAYLTSALIRAMQFDGGWAVENIPPNSSPVFAGALHIPIPGKCRMLGHLIHPPVVSLGHIGGEDKLTTLGAWHIMEGAAMPFKPWRQMGIGAGSKKSSAGYGAGLSPSARKKR